MCNGGSEIGLCPDSELESESESERKRDRGQKDLTLLFITIPNTCTWRPDFWRKYVRPLLLSCRGFGSGFDVWRGTAATLGAIGSGLGSGAALSAVHRSY